MTTLKDRVLNSSLDDIVEVAERGEIDPDELWDEVLESLDCTVESLRRANQRTLPRQRTFGFRSRGSKIASTR